MKEKVTLSINENTLKRAKETIPNLSQFVEGCFEACLKYITKDDEDKGEELTRAWQQFNEAKLTIHILTEVDYEQKEIAKAIQRQKNNTWLQLWGEYRKFGKTTNTQQLETAAKTLETTTDKLEKLLSQTFLESRNNIKELYVYDRWDYIQQNILPKIDEIEDEEEIDIDAILNS